MKTSDFFGKFKSRYLWGNLAAMAILTVAIALGVRYGIDLYTHHGESIAVPDVRHKTFSNAERIMADQGLRIVVSDTGYVKTLPPDCILEQTPAAGQHVKSGRVIYVVVNASHTPTISLPDIIDNSSLREAMSKLSAMGFKLAMPQYVPGEKDWVYGVLVKGRHVVAGDRISIEDSLTIQVGNGLRDSTEMIDYVDPVYPEYEDDDVDEFEEVTGPEPSTPAPTQPSEPQEPKNNKAEPQKTDKQTPEKAE